MANKKRKKQKYETAGAPSKYKPEYCEELIEYFNVPPYIGDESSDFRSLSGFAIKIGVSRDTLLEWSKVHPEFEEPYKRVKDFQENYILVNGNKGLINPQFGMFTAKNILGYRDKQPGESDVVVNNNNLTNMSDEEIEAKLEKLTGKK
jgi:hypothetical protein